MKNTLLILTLFILLFNSCKEKETTSPSLTTIGSSFFIEGKGMRKIWGMESETKGLGGWGLQQLTTTADGFISTIFTYGLGGINGAPATYVGYRKKINMLTGDTVATNGIPSFISKTYMGQQQFGCLEYGMLPYTDKFVYLNGAQIKGDPDWTALTFGGFEKIYDTRQALCKSYSNVAAPNLFVSYTNNGVANNPNGYKINPLALNASVEMPLVGGPIAFIPLKSDSLIVLDFDSKTILAGVPMELFLQYIPSNFPYNHMPTCFITTKRNREGTKIIGAVFHSANYFSQGQGRMMSTFVYDIASKALTLKVKNAHLKQGFYITATEDLDDDGNFYYQPDIQKIDPIIIHKVTPSGDVLYKSGFVNAGRLYSLKVVSNKLIIACGVDGTSNVGQATTKATMVIAVEE